MTDGVSVHPLALASYLDQRYSPHFIRKRNEHQWSEAGKTSITGTY